jgi:hypothetical protein
MLQTVLFATDEKVFRLRGRAIEAMGHFAIAVGKEKFRLCNYYALLQRHTSNGQTILPSNDGVMCSNRKFGRHGAARVFARRSFECCQGKFIWICSPNTNDCTMVVLQVMGDEFAPYISDVVSYLNAVVAERDSLPESLREQDNLQGM